jgi:hypothetical protein
VRNAYQPLLRLTANCRACRPDSRCHVLSCARRWRRHDPLCAHMPLRSLAVPSLPLRTLPALLVMHLHWKHPICMTRPGCMLNKAWLLRSVPDKQERALAQQPPGGWRTGYFMPAQADRCDTQRWPRCAWLRRAGL